MKRAVQLFLLALAAFLSMATSRQMPPAQHPEPVQVVVEEPAPEPVVVVTEPAPPPEPVIVVAPLPPPPVIVVQPRFASPPP